MLEPKWSVGDDLCCPKTQRVRDYGFDPARGAFVRTDDREIEAPKPGGAATKARGGGTGAD
ncbi:MAG: hypothetical protein HZB46_08645 [Solirubrobacterales bacterium]|nr:hypothetical protein [Solirubrobacterales bacterium]